MKSKLFLLTLAMSVAYSSNVLAQSSVLCSNGTTPYIISYDTASAGNGTELYHYRFPKFDPSLGTLAEVTIETLITLNFGFEVENRNNTNANARVRLERYDDIVSDSLMAPLSHSYITNFGPYLLQPADAITASGQDYFQKPVSNILNAIPVTYHITGTAPFMGIDSLAFDYNTGTYTTITGASNIVNSSAADDYVAFKLTYSYCPVALLATDIINFGVRKSGDNVVINWTAPNDVPGQLYILQKCTDGKNFRDVFSTGYGMAINAVYHYQAPLNSNDGIITYYRVKSIDASGHEKYSEVRSLKLSSIAAQFPSVFPTIVHDAINIRYPGAGKTAWILQLVSMDGKTILRQQLYGSGVGHLNLPGNLQRGQYVVQFTNPLTFEPAHSDIFLQ